MGPLSIDRLWRKKTQKEKDTNKGATAEDKPNNILLAFAAARSLRCKPYQ